MTKADIARMDNESLVGTFVAFVGADYKTDYSPQIYPTFSEDTKMVWEEVESRLTERFTLNFNRKECIAMIQSELENQRDIIKDCHGSTISYHHGIISGLNLAWTFINRNLVPTEKRKE